MSTEKLSGKVAITEEGAIFIGKYVACDGANVEKPISIISHAHGDHVKGFESALSFCPAVLVTKETKNLLIADRGDWLLKRRNLIDLPFGTTYTYDDIHITLYPTNHMLGSCQVLLENSERTRIVYTGEFNYPNTPVLKTDVLVMEATYGSPEAIRTRDRDSLTEKLVLLTKEELERRKPVYIFAHPGKIQCLMSKLKSANLNVPFLAHRKDVKWANVYRQHGLDVGTVYEMGTREALEIQKSSSPYVSFNRLGSIVPEAEKHLTIRASAFMAKEDIYQPRENYYVIALSDHADFNGLLEYVKKSEAKLVITDASRCGMATTLAEQIRNRLNIDAKGLPY